MNGRKHYSKDNRARKGAAAAAFAFALIGYAAVSAGGAERSYPLADAAAGQVAALSGGANAALSGGADASLSGADLALPGANAAMDSANARAAYSIADYHQWRDKVESQTFRGEDQTYGGISAYNAPDAAAAAYQPQADNGTTRRGGITPFRINMPDFANLRGAAVNAVIDGDKDAFTDAFTNFYARTQLQLLQQADEYLSNLGEGALLSNFPADIKSARVDFQSKLGGRKGNLGVNVIGALSDEPNDAIGWQLRLYGAQEESKGANFGLFYRHRITDPEFAGAQIGGNAFLDYEDHKYGGFFRYSIGGEARYKYASLAANYYRPITDERRVRDISEQTFAFSRHGYDARLRFILPSLQQFRAAVDYYHFRGKERVKAEKGLRYGAEAAPLPGLNVAILYDSRESEFGGDINYTHTIGGHQQVQVAIFETEPDLFSPVWREHSQRIALITRWRSETISGGGLADFVASSGVITVTTGIMAGAGLLSLYPPESSVFLAEESAAAGFSFAGGTLLFTQPTSITMAATTTTPMLECDAQNVCSVPADPTYIFSTYLQTIAQNETTIAAATIYALDSDALATGVLVYQITAAYPLMVSIADPFVIENRRLDNGTRADIEVRTAAPGAFVISTGHTETRESIADIAVVGGVPPYTRELSHNPHPRWSAELVGSQVFARYAGAIQMTDPPTVETLQVTIRVDDSNFAQTQATVVAITIIAREPLLNGLMFAGGLTYLIPDSGRRTIISGIMPGAGHLALFDSGSQLYLTEGSRNAGFSFMNGNLEFFQATGVLFTLTTHRAIDIADANSARRIVETVMTIEQEETTIAAATVVAADTTNGASLSLVYQITASHPFTARVANPFIPTTIRTPAGMTVIPVQGAPDTELEIGPDAVLTRGNLAQIEAVGGLPPYTYALSHNPHDRWGATIINGRLVAEYTGAVPFQAPPTVDFLTATVVVDDSSGGDQTTPVTIIRNLQAIAPLGGMVTYADVPICGNSSGCTYANAVTVIWGGGQRASNGTWGGLNNYSFPLSDTDPGQHWDGRSEFTPPNGVQKGGIRIGIKNIPNHPTVISFGVRAWISNPGIEARAFIRLTVD